MLRPREAATQLNTVSSWDPRQFVSTLVFSTKAISTDMLTVNIDSLLSHHEGDGINRVLPKKAHSEGRVLPFPPPVAHLGQSQTESLAGGRGEGRWRGSVSACSSCAHSTSVSLILH